MKKMNEYLRIKEVAKFVGVTENTLRNWEQRQKVKVYRNPQNDHRLYEKEDLEQLLAEIKQPYPTSHQAT